MNKGGVDLISEAAIAMAPVARFYELSRPFLIILKKRDAPDPFFMIWVDNSELLVPFTETGAVK